MCCHARERDGSEWVNARVEWRVGVSIKVRDRARARVGLSVWVWIWIWFWVCGPNFKYR